MRKVLIISDVHFGHHNIHKKFRKCFSSDEEHDETIFENIMSAGNKRDTLWMLGDMFFNREVLAKYGEPIRKHYGYTFLILGNHDTDNEERAEMVGQMWTMFDGVHSMVSRKGAWLTHCPMHETELYGKINIHGHIHNKIVPDERYFNACCENINYKPVNFQDIKGGYRGRNVHQVMY